jgi:hypothetical protein
MAELLADIKLRWYDDSALIEDGPRRLLELFLDSIGVTSDVACDIFEVVVMARANDVSLTSAEVKAAVLELRRRRMEGDSGFGMTDRNIQVWLRYYETIGLFEKISGKHRLYGNKTPSEAFKRTRRVVEESLGYSGRLASKLEKAYGIR